MFSKLRIWRVVPTCKTGVQAPYFFVETTELERQKAEVEAKRLASQRTALANFKNWRLVITKEFLRKDRFGRYVRYHQ